MKKNKLKIITIILLIILITMVGFFGVYTKVGKSMKDAVKDYKYATDLDGERIVTLELDTTTSDIIKDSEGNIIESATDEEIQQKGYTKEQKPANAAESLTSDNYNLTKSIIEKRLNKLNVSSYTVKVDEETGKIIVELPEDDNIDNIISNLTTVGKFELIDTDTKEVLLTNDNIKTSEVLKSNTATGTAIYFTIEFNGEGKKKLEEITKTYVKAPEETTTSETENTEEQTQEENTTPEEATNTQDASEQVATEETATEETTTEESQTDADTNKEKTVTMKIDDEEVMSTSFDETITDGKMYLTVGQSSTDKDTLNSNLKQARNMSAALSYKNLPLKYNVGGNEYVASPVKGKVTQNMINCIGIVILVITLALIFKYRLKGLFAAISYIGFVALLLLIIRYWNVVISIDGLASIGIILILNLVLIKKILAKINEEKENSKADIKHIINMQIKEFTLKIIPLFIISIVFSFMQWSSTNSFGMVMFWGLTLIELYNLIITKNLLKYKEM